VTTPACTATGHCSGGPAGGVCAASSCASNFHPREVSREGEAARLAKAGQLHLAKVERERTRLGHNFERIEASEKLGAVGVVSGRGLARAGWKREQQRCQAWPEANGNGRRASSAHPRASTFRTQPCINPSGCSAAGSAERVFTVTEAAAPLKPRESTEQAQLIAMLSRPRGATIAQIVRTTGWQPHTVRGAIAGALKKRLGLAVTSEKVDGTRVYRIA
jgi:hypothetical protein